MYAKPIFVKPLESYKILIKYNDGLEGIIDLSHLANKGVFLKWNEQDYFKKVFINKENDSIAWDEDLEICPNTLYLDLKEN